MIKDNLGRALKLLDVALGEIDRTLVIKSRMPIVALRLAAAGVLVLMDIAMSLRELNGYEEVSDADNQT